MFRAHRPVFRRIHTAVPTTTGSVSVPFWLRVLYTEHAMFCIQNTLCSVHRTRYMFWAHRTIFRRIHTAVPTTIGSVSVPFWSRVLYTEHAMFCIQNTLCSVYRTRYVLYTEHATCFGPTGLSSGEFTQLFPQPLVQYPYRSGRVFCIQNTLHVSGPQAHLQENSHSCSHNHSFSIRTVLVACSVYRTRYVLYTQHATCFGPTGPSSGEFTQLFTQPLVQYPYRSGRVFCIQNTLHVSGPQAHLQENSHSCSHNHWFSIRTVLVACSVYRTCYIFWAHKPMFRKIHTAVHTTIGSVSISFWSRVLYVVAGHLDWPQHTEHAIRKI